jgi:hypothetical protein
MRPGQLVIVAVTSLIVLANSIAAADGRALAVVQRDQELKDAKLSMELTMLRTCRAEIDSYLQAVLGGRRLITNIHYI